MSAVMVLAGFGQNDKWTGFIYPDRNTLTVSTEIGRFRTLEQCRAASVRTLAVFSRSDGGRLSADALAVVVPARA